LDRTFTMVFVRPDMHALLKPFLPIVDQLAANGVLGYDARIWF
jgi:hypothetical protein